MDGMSASAVSTVDSRGATTLRQAEPDFGLYAIVLNVIGVAALAYGLRTLEGTDIGGSVIPALGGMVSQLSITAWPAVAVALATIANLVLGAVLMRVIAGRPFTSLTSFFLAGLVGTVLVDGALLMVLGGIGLYIWPLVILAPLAGLLVAWRWGWPLLVVHRPDPSAWLSPLAFILPGIVWGAAVLLQLASPVVPFMDVLFNHVSPVEHVRVFGSFDVLTTSPSPNFGPSRPLLGYVALEAVLSVATRIPAALSISAFILPLLLLFAAAMHRLASVLFGGRAGYWTLLTLPLSFVFLRLPDARATSLVFVLAAWVLATLVAPPDLPRLRRQLLLAAGIGACLLMHAFIGALLVATVVLLAIAWPLRFARLAAPALMGGSLLALPQAAATLAMPLPSWIGIAAIIPAAAGFWIGRRWSVLIVRVTRIAVAALLIGALLVISDVVRFSVEALRDMAAQFPLLAFTSVVGFVLLRRRPGIRVLGAALAIGLLAVVGSRLLPPDSPLVQSLQGEVNPKALWYWGPLFMALVAAGAANRLTSGGRWPAIGQAIVGIFVIVAILPVRLAPAVVGLDNYEEHRMAESTSILLRHATQGYWVGYPDSRDLLNDAQEQIVARLDADREAGIVTDQTRILHLAESFRPWVGTPIAVFTGITESTASLDPERSIHTEGGRLLDLSQVPAELGAGYDYVLVEGAPLVDEYDAQVAAAGFVPILENERGILFRAASLGPAS
jgi:hypothetical protein